MSFAPTAQLWIDADRRPWRRDADGERIAPGDPVDALVRFIDEAEPLGDELPVPRTVGHFGYDLGPLLEPHFAARANPDRDTPLAYLARYDAVVACLPHGDEGNAPCRLVVSATSESAAAPLVEAITAADAGDRDASPSIALGAPSSLIEAPSWPEYRHAFTKALDYIAAGDVYQVNLARRFLVESATRPADAYLELRRVQPVPHGLYLDCGGYVVLSNSPERFIAVRDGRIRTEPIKGTRRRNPNADVDRELGAGLADDPKERAEHVMIVDLERNDIGRIAEHGTVRATSLLRLESYQTVHHLVSTIEGRLRDGTDLAAILRATFPGGSITGAPKLRASEVIAELEPLGRGPYTGALAWFHSSSDFDSSIAIRTAIARAGRYSYFAGGGIVADSEARREFDECWLKARAFLAALLGDEPSLATVGPRHAPSEQSAAAATPRPPA